MFRSYIKMNDENFADIAKPICKQSKRTIMIITIVEFLILAAYTIYKLTTVNKPTAMVIGAIMLVAEAAIVVLCVVRCKRLEKKVVAYFKNQMMTVHHAENYEREIIFGEESIISETEPEKKELFYRDVLECVETDKNFVFKLNGKLVVWAQKDCIEGGSMEEFRNFIASKVQKVSW